MTIFSLCLPLIYDRVVISENADSNMITEKVRSHVPDVEIERDTIKEIDYNLPSEDIDRFAGDANRLTLRNIIFVCS